MHSDIVSVREEKRGCGHRKPGGLYLRCDGIGRGCGKLPIPLQVCPVCGEGIRPSRAPRMLQTPELLWDSLTCATTDQCPSCPLRDGHAIGPSLLIWVGEGHYPTPKEFNEESAMMGISRRITSIPHGFRLGETWVLLAHKSGFQLPVIQDPAMLKMVDSDGDPLFTTEPQYEPAIFRVFQPDRIEIVVTGDEDDETIDGYLKRGLIPVVIEEAEEVLGREMTNEAYELANIQAAMSEWRTAPRSITDTEMNVPIQIAFQAILDTRGKEGREERLRVMSTLAGREITSFNNLSAGEAFQFMEWLLEPETKPEDGRYRVDAVAVMKMIHTGEVYGRAA